MEMCIFNVWPLVRARHERKHELYPTVWRKRFKHYLRNLVALGQNPNTPIIKKKKKKMETWNIGGTEASLPWNRDGIFLSYSVLSFSGNSSKLFMNLMIEDGLQVSNTGAEMKNRVIWENIEWVMWADMSSVEYSFKANATKHIIYNTCMSIDHPPSQVLALSGHDF